MSQREMLMVNARLRYRMLYSKEFWHEAVLCKLIFLALVFFSALPENLFAIGWCELGGVKYFINDVGAHVNSYDDKVSAYVNIPEYIEYNNAKYKVNSISTRAFWKKTISSIVIPDTVESVGTQAFAGCYAIYDDKTIPGVVLVDGWVVDAPTPVSGDLFLHSIRGISDYAFDSDDNITSATISSGHIGRGAFSQCGSITNAVIGNAVKSIDGYVFFGCYNLETVKLPDNLTIIPQDAFYGCTKIDNILIPASVTTISNEAFQRCFNLSNVTIPTGVKHIGVCAFADCKSLISVTIPETVSEIGSSAFNGTQCTIHFNGRPPSIVNSYGEPSSSSIRSNGMGTYIKEYENEWLSVMDDNGYWNGIKMAQKGNLVITFKKDTSELNASCDKAYWWCYDSGGCTAFPVFSGEAFSMPPGTYTIYPHSGEPEFADPEPIIITINGTEDRVEREVLLQRKKVKFNCRFYNTAQRDYGILPNSLGLDSYCTWRIDGGEWLTPGQSVEIVTGTHNLELNIDERIHLMAWTDILSTPITLDGSATEHTEWINVLGADGAKVKFGFSIMNSITSSSNFNESLVDVTLRNSSGDTMTVPAGEYCLPKGDYIASFSYRWATSGQVLWRAPNDIEFSVKGRDREFNLFFVDIEIAPFDWTTAIWFDANGGASEATVLRYAQPTYSDYIFGSVPEASREGYVFLGWFSSKSGGRRFTKDSFVPKYDDSGIEYVDVDNERRIHLYAHWKKTNMTPSWLSFFATINAASNGDVEFAGALTAANGKMTVSDCFDVGVNPEDPNDDFKITEFRMENGEPVFAFNHTEDGAGNSFTSNIKILAAKSIGDDASWVNMTEVSESEKTDYKFFKAVVEQPQ